MARIFDVIEYPNEMADELVHRFPDDNSIGDYRIGSQLIVREAQSAVFFRDGNALDVFHAGRHTITTANVPVLINFIGKAFNDRTPFPAEVYFVSMKEWANKKVGHASTDHRPQSRRGTRCSALARLWNLFLPNQRPANVRDQDRRHTGNIPHIRYRRSFAYHALIKASRYPRRNWCKAFRLGNDRIDRRTWSWRPRQSAG